jgi:hypothetical protein
MQIQKNRQFSKILQKVKKKISNIYHSPFDSYWIPKKYKIKAP